MLSLGKTDLRSHYATQQWTQPYHWYERGRGTPVVLLHGYMAHAMAYRRVLAHFGEYRVLIPDLPGHGYDRTFEDPALPASVEGLGQWLEGFLDELDEPAHVIAHSMGALAATHADTRKMRSLTLVAPGLRIPAPSWAAGVVDLIPPAIARLSGSRLALKVYEPIQWRGVPMNAAERSAYLRPLKQSQRVKFMLGLGADLLRQPDRLSQLNTPECPTLVVWGENDHLLKLQDALAVRKQLKGSSLAIIPRAGHPVMEDEPDAFADVVLEFIQASMNP